MGDPEVISRFEEIQREILTKKRDGEKLKRDVSDMRLRMIKELDKTTHGIFDLKHGRGGLVDLEFMVQYLMLLNAHNYPDLAKWTDVVRIHVYYELVIRTF